MRSGEVVDLGERLAIEARLDDAFADLRAERCDLSPLRARAAVRWGRARPRAAVGWSGPLRRLTEVSVAVCATLMVFTSTLRVESLGLAPERDVDAMRLEQREYVRQVFSGRSPFVAGERRGGVETIHGIVGLRRLIEPVDLTPNAVNGLAEIRRLAAAAEAPPAPSGPEPNRPQ